MIKVQFSRFSGGFIHTLNTTNLSLKYIIESLQRNDFIFIDLVDKRGRVIIVTGEQND